MSIDALTRATDTLVQVTGLSQEAVDELREAARSPRLLPGGGFHTTTQIDSLVGLAGDYLWSENLLAVRTIRFTFDPGSVGSAGTYSIRSGPLVVEEGTFQCFAAGSGATIALLFLRPTGGPERIFIIAGAFIEADATVTIMILADFNVVGLIIPRFSAVRLP
jgi:hypothetical protein